MAFPTSVNSQITDAVTQTNVKVLAEAPAQALAQLYQTMAQAAGLAGANAVTAQQQGNDLATAVTTRCVEALVK